MSYVESEAIDYNNRRGYTREQWREVQGVIGASVDGIPGVETARRARDWQAANGLTADGKVGPDTLQVMVNSAPLPPSTGHEPPGATRNRDTRRIASDESRDIMIDVSRYQGDIDWPALATWSGLSGVILKATQSREKRGGMKPFVDSKYLSGVDGARRCSVPWGSYHLAVVTRGDGSIVTPEDDARYVASKLVDGGGPLGLWVDWETTWVEDAVEALGSKKAAADWMEAHLVELERLTGRRPGMYWSHRGVKALGAEAERFRHKYRHWWAYYYSDSKPLPKTLSEHPGKPDGWPWALWQFSSSGRCVGVKGGDGDVDLIVCAPDALSEAA